MIVHPIIAALRHHKVAALLTVLQIALTLAIVANAVFVLGQRIERTRRPTGLVEAGLIRILQQWPNADLALSDARQRADLATLRQLADVEDAAASASIPLTGGYTTGDITLSPSAPGIIVHVAYYYGDERLRSTLGLRLVAGRDFLTGEIRHGHPRADAPVIMVTQAVARQLFPDRPALGQTVYQDGHPATIVGVVERLQTPARAAGSWAYNSVLEPLRADGAYAGYVVRARPGQTDAAMRETRKALFELDPMRLMPEPWAGIHTFEAIRAKAYRADRGMAWLLGSISLILLGVTATGIVGLTSFWVVQRRRQIGIRRALGARRVDIRRHVQLENLIICGVGAAAGGLAALTLNAWLMTHYETARLPVAYVLAGAVAMIGVGQAAVLVPAQRASKVSPMVATRSR